MCFLSMLIPVRKCLMGETDCTTDLKKTVVLASDRKGERIIRSSELQD